ncbi:hypothetical protein [Micromonospora sp. WMMD714]|uniref:hypothetical protein n=1 Tax=Micromonospora sp. WMMD714 TaxID=3016097 RepID=UPI00249C922C|nr:hypothetical protein [Micromonospora sp. WMMD714]WFE66811.1 hypothetical protein O7625_27500 [Micromonospora sp. WMMD714]
MGDEVRALLSWAAERAQLRWRRGAAQAGRDADVDAAHALARVAGRRGGAVRHRWA